MFLNTIGKFSKHFGDQAVVITGEVSSEERQKRVDRFQSDDNIRAFIANTIIGGVGLNLTAARQVVFNDLDWVPANHWQAEDRAYRIGQTGSVNVTYMIANGTVDEFVKTVLETKARLMEDLIEGKAMGDDLQMDVIGELKRMMKILSFQLADIPDGVDGENQMVAMLRDASATYIKRNSQHISQAAQKQLIPYSQDAIRALAKVLAGTQRQIYQVESSSKPGKFYQLEVIGVDVTCGCPGFEYRGNCTHARTLKSVLVSGKALPKGFTAVNS